MKEKEENVAIAALHRGSQRMLESIRVVGRDAWRRGSAACSEWTRCDSIAIETIVDRQLKTSGKLQNGGVVKGEKAVENEGQSSGSKGAPKGMRVVRRFNGAGRN